ncbi:SRPBCC family protein [Paenibacillus oralis]|nr:SRPBCC family protein [Paenibacillus oralis]
MRSPIENPKLMQEQEDWVLVLERVLNHPPEKVWDGLTRVDQVPKWGPFSADKDLVEVGAVRLKPINTPEAEEMEGYVLEVNAPYLLVFRWGEDILRWELAALGQGKTTLVLRHRFEDRKQAPSYAAGWHLCLDGLAGTLAGEQMPSMVGEEALKYGWQELYEAYAEKLGIHTK